MVSDFGYILLFLIAALATLVGTLTLARLLRPNRPNVEKLTTYESGEDPEGTANVQFNIRYYVIALVFVLFDVELVFLFPWATVFGNEALIRETGGRWGWFALVEMLIFLGILALGLAYAWVKGHLDWVKPEVKKPEVRTRVPGELYEKLNEKYARRSERIAIREKEEK
jgi:NADH-quinone oxidoreductase subunit A